jgi:presenilin-like A22 family membrane protease
VVPEYDVTVAIARVIAARRVCSVTLSQPTHRVGSGQYVVTVRLISATINLVTVFIQRRIFADIIAVLVQIVDVHGYVNAVRVIPRAISNAISRINLWQTVNRCLAKIGPPSRTIITTPDRRRQGLAVRIRSS